ncbi:hypothetical protein EC973_003475 [Apophysomyces ossiformis]|uniref:Ubiquitin-like domain-containing protein n=1 Tax=Apophysomyces ossiformis TaxID=679940 RepID=A0A8H7EQK9_9FUNG|nr:hypothetical protein EC973_003475 [Apophysomyces ossiformis]
MTSLEKDEHYTNDTLTVQIRSPSLNETLTVTIASDSTVRALKKRIQSVHPQRPSPGDQRVIYGGKLLEDAAIMKHILEKADLSTLPTFHLVVKPSAKMTNSTTAPAVATNTTNSSQQQQAPLQETSQQPHQQQIPNPSPPSFTATTYPALLPGGYQVVAINGQYFLAPVLVPAYNLPSLPNHPLPTTQNTYYLQTPQQNHPQQQQQQQQQQQNTSPASTVHRARNEVQRATSIWLAMKLIVILFIMCQGANIYRIVFFHIAAFIFFLYQTGRLRVVIRRVSLEELGRLGNQPVRGTVPGPAFTGGAATSPLSANATLNNVQRDSSQAAPSSSPSSPLSTTATDPAAGTDPAGSSSSSPTASAGTHPETPATFLEALKRGAYTFLASLWPNYGHDPRIAQAFENGQQDGLEGF